MDRREELAVAAPNSVESEWFFCVSKIALETSAKFSPRRLRASVAEMLEANPVLYVHEDWVFCEEGVEIRLTVRPKPASCSEGQLRNVAMLPTRSFWGGGEESIRNAVVRNAKQHSALSAPYLVIVNAIGERFFGDLDGDVLDGLFGTRRITTWLNKEKREFDRNANGAWIGSQGPRNSKVSAVMVTNAWPTNLDDAYSKLFHNPWAAMPLGAETLTVSTCRIENGKDVHTPGQLLGAALNVSAEYRSLVQQRD